MGVFVFLSVRRDSNLCIMWENWTGCWSRWYPAESGDQDEKRLDRLLHIRHPLTWHKTCPTKIHKISSINYHGNSHGPNFSFNSSSWRVAVSNTSGWSINDDTPMALLSSTSTAGRTTTPIDEWTSGVTTCRVSLVESWMIVIGSQRLANDWACCRKVLMAVGIALGGWFLSNIINAFIVLKSSMEKSGVFIWDCRFDWALRTIEPISLSTTKFKLLIWFWTPEEINFRNRENQKVKIWNSSDDGMIFWDSNHRIYGTAEKSFHWEYHDDVKVPDRIIIFQNNHTPK